MSNNFILSHFFLMFIAGAITMQLGIFLGGKMERKKYLEMRDRLFDQLFKNMTIHVKKAEDEKISG